MNFEFAFKNHFQKTSKSRFLFKIQYHSQNSVVARKMEGFVNEIPNQKLTTTTWIMFWNFNGDVNKF